MIRSSVNLNYQELFPILIICHLLQPIQLSNRHVWRHSDFLCGVFYHAFCLLHFLGFAIYLPHLLDHLEQVFRSFSHPFSMIAAAYRFEHVLDGLHQLELVPPFIQKFYQRSTLYQLVVLVLFPLPYVHVDSSFSSSLLVLDLAFQHATKN